jgi:DNA-binding CsgD family transcriptional regulator
MADAFTALGHAVALIGPDGRIVHAAAAFERLLNNGIYMKAGRFGCWHPDAHRALAAAIDRAIRHDGLVREPGRPVVLPRRNGQRPLIAEVIPVVGAAQDLFQRVSAIAIVTDPDAATAAPCEPILLQAFGLTAAEARLGAQITAGKTLPEISRADGIARETLRTRLKSIFQKTGTTRQTQLALLLSRFAGGGA